jgi:hypothetical protein
MEVVLAALAFMGLDSPASVVLAAWTRSPRAASTHVNGFWASHSMSSSGTSLRSSSAIATSSFGGDTDAIGSRWWA